MTEIEWLDKIQKNFNQENWDDKIEYLNINFPTETDRLVSLYSSEAITLDEAQMLFNELTEGRVPGLLRG